jgi:nucleoside-diphosphate-sugar epimerase
MKERTAFITGGTGFLGSHLAESLRNRQWRVVALHRAGSDTSRLKALGAELRPGDLEDKAALAQAIPHGTDAVFHAAAKVSFWTGDKKRMHQANVLGTRNLVEACLSRGVGKLIHTSSVAVYGFQPGRRVRETFPQEGIRSKVPYLSTKAGAETEVQRGIDQGLDAVILQPTNILGRYDSHNWGRLFRMIRDGKTGGAPRGSGSFVHAQAAAEAHIAAVDQGRTGARYILATTDAPFLELFRHAESLLGRAPRLKPVPAAVISALGWISQGISQFTRKAPDLTPEVARIMNSECLYSGALAQAELGLKPMPVEEMLRDCHDWLKREALI